MSEIISAVLAARELAPSLLSTNAQTWVNLHLLFTHGNGIVMSPVTQKSAEGLPNFYLKNIPPIASGGPDISEPRIYFGQGAGGYVIVKSSTPEFNYPTGKENVYANYVGADGIAIDGAAWRTLFAWYLNDVNILLSRYIINGSRIVLHRNIQDRVQTIAPFLQLDRDLDDYDGTATFYAVDAADPTGASSPRCSSRSMPCQRICKGTSATRKICSLSRRNSTALTTWIRLKSSTIARTSGSFPASRPAPTATTSAAALG
jgi:uncharacterized membrane protein (UPF0182 family)